MAKNKNNIKFEQHNQFDTADFRQQVNIEEEIYPLRVIIDKPTLDLYLDANEYGTSNKVRARKRYNELQRSYFATGLQLDISKFITSLTLNQSISGNYDTCSIKLKMNITSYRYFFGDNLNNISTNQMIAIQRPTLKANKDIDFSKKIIPSFNGDNVNIYQKQKDMSDIESVKNDLKNVEIGKVDFDETVYTKKEIEDVVNTKGKVSITQKLKKVIDKSKKINEDLFEVTSDKVKKGYEDPEKYLLYTAIFFGQITNISSTYSVDSKGNQIFNVILDCESFIHSLMNTEFIYGIDNLKYEILKTTDGKNIAEYIVDGSLASYITGTLDYDLRLNDDKNINQIQYLLNNWIKSESTWDAIIDDFTTGKNRKIYEGEEDTNIINLRYQIKKLIRIFGQNILPIRFQPPVYRRNMYGEESNEIINDKIFGNPINPGGWLKLGLVINVITEQQHLPIGCDYRQFLPVNSLMATSINAGLKSDSLTRSVLVPWNIILGTFVPDPNIVECFPILIPIDNYSELQLKQQINTTIEEYKKSIHDQDFIPDFNDDTEKQIIYDFYVLLGGIPSIVYRHKLLPPEYALNQISYKRLLAEHFIAQYKYDTELFYDNKKYVNNKRLSDITSTLQKELEFISEKISINKDGGIEINSNGVVKINQDVCYANHLPRLNFKDIINFTTSYDENDRINLVEITEPAGGVTSGAAFDKEYKEKVVSNWYNILQHGIRRLKIEYPFNDSNSTSLEYLKAIAERMYAIYNERNKQASGIITIKDEAINLLKGSWLRLILRDEKDILLTDKLDTFELQEYFQKYFDFYCYIESINREYTVDTTGNLQTYTTIKYSRGKFGLIPSAWPEIISSVITSNSNNIIPQNEQSNIDKALEESRKNENQNINVNLSQDNDSFQNIVNGIIKLFKTNKFGKQKIKNPIKIKNKKIKAGINKIKAK
jgi:hypothetical protein